MADGMENVFCNHLTSTVSVGVTASVSISGHVTSLPFIAVFGRVQQYTLTWY